MFSKKNPENCKYIFCQVCHPSLDSIWLWSWRYTLISNVYLWFSCCNHKSRKKHSLSGTLCNFFSFLWLTALFEKIHSCMAQNIGNSAWISAKFKRIITRTQGWRLVDAVKIHLSIYLIYCYLKVYFLFLNKTKKSWMNCIIAVYRSIYRPLPLLGNIQYSLQPKQSLHAMKTE